MSFKKSKKVSAFHVYSEEQGQTRRSGSYRNLSPRTRTGNFDSPTRRDDRSGSCERRLDQDMDRVSHSRRRNSNEGMNSRYENVSDYHRRHIPNSPHRETRRYDSFERPVSHDRVRDRYSDREWEDRSVECDHHSGRGHYRDRAEDDYLIVDMKEREMSHRGATKYSDSDDECLHESLRRRKRTVSYSSEDERPRWGSDPFDNETDDYRQDRKRSFSNHHRDSLSPPAKLWRRNGDEPDRAVPSDTEKFSSRDRVAGSKKKKGKGKKTMKGKDKKRGSAGVEKRDMAVFSSGGKIPSLMDLEFPPSLAARNLEPGASDVLPSFNSKISSFGFGRRRSDSDSRNLSRPEGDRFTDRESDRYARDTQYRARRHSSDDDGHRHPVGSRRSPEFDRYFEDDQGRHDRHRRTSYSTDYRNERRNQHSSSDYRMQRDGTPDPGVYSDSEQDSEREGARRLWREERRERQPEKKTSVRDNKRNRKRHDPRPIPTSTSTATATSTSKLETKKKKEVQIQEKETVKKEKRKEPEKALEPSARFKVKQCGENLVVFLTHPQEICLRGRTKLRVLAGTVSIMGHEISASHSQLYDLYSPTSGSLLTIKTCTAETDKKALRRSLRSVEVNEADVKEFMKGAVVLKAQQLPSPLVDYLCVLPPYTQLFRFSSERGGGATKRGVASQEMVSLGAAFFPLHQAPNLPLKWTQDMETALSKWTSQLKKSGAAPVVLLCGGVNSGKSTFGRYMINAALNIIPKVCYLNCDVGQTEFSPPGSVALHVIENPVLGPPFCHQKTAESMCFFGQTSPADGPSHYVQCLQYVWQAYQKVDPPLPLVVNTMGWNEGLGLKLFVDVMALTSPDMVIQFNCSNPTLNFPAITSEFSAVEPGWLYNTEPVSHDKERVRSAKKHELVTVDSIVSTRTETNKIKLTPKNLRDLALLAHLMKGFHPTVTLTSAVPYAVPWCKLAVHACHSQVSGRLIWAALNASVVALCCADLSEAKRPCDNSPMFFDETPVCDCLGYGLVRAVDAEQQLVYIITPLPRSDLARVNTLIKGAVNIPDQLFLKQSYLEEVPYVDALAPATALAPVRPRCRMPRKMGPTSS